MIVATFNGAIAHVSRTQAVGNVRPSNFSLMSKKPRHVVRAGQLLFMIIYVYASNFN